jgi:hypothetical protein
VSGSHCDTAGALPLAQGNPPLEDLLWVGLEQYTKAFTSDDHSDPISVGGVPLNADVDSWSFFQNYRASDLDISDWPCSTQKLQPSGLLGGNVRAAQSGICFERNPGDVDAWSCFVSDNQCGSSAPAEDNHKVSSSAAHIESIGDVDSWSQFQLLSGQSPPATLVEADQLSTLHFTTISDNTPQQLEAAGDVDSWSHFSIVNDQVRPKTPRGINQICQLDGMDHLFGRAIINSEVAGDVDSWSQFICEN